MDPNGDRKTAVANTPEGRKQWKNKKKHIDWNGGGESSSGSAGVKDRGGNDAGGGGKKKGPNYLRMDVRFYSKRVAKGGGTRWKAGKKKTKQKKVTPGSWDKGKKRYLGNL